MKVRGLVENLRYITNFVLDHEFNLYIYCANRWTNTSHVWDVKFTFSHKHGWFIISKQFMPHIIFTNYACVCLNIFLHDCNATSCVMISNNVQNLPDSFYGKSILWCPDTGWLNITGTYFWTDITQSWYGTLNIFKNKLVLFIKGC